MPERDEAPGSSGRTAASSAVDDAVARLARTVFSTETPTSVFELVASLSAHTVEGVDQASVTLMERNRLRTAAATDHEARDLDEQQYALEEGPCVDAARLSQTSRFQGGDRAEPWPAFRAVAVRRGVAGILSLPLHAGERPLGALNLYAMAPGRLDDCALEPASILAECAGVVLANAGDYFSAMERAEQLLEALETRDTIGQAKGIVMATQRCTPDEAFDILRRASQRENRKLRDLAADIVERTQRRSDTHHP